jgi:ribosomal protein S18 acetylase RimI-like enzyme
MSGEVRRLRLASATGDDLDAVGALLRDLNLEVEDATPSAQVLSTRVAELLGDGDTEILLAGEPPVGLAVLRLRKAIWTAHREASLAELYVVPARRGEELEHELVETAMATARERGADFIELSAGSSDVAARRLYEDLGFDNHEVGSEEGLALHYERPL